MMCRTMTVGRCRPDRCRLLHLHAGDGMGVSEEGASLLLVRVGPRDHSTCNARGTDLGLSSESSSSQARNFSFPPIEIGLQT